MRRPLIILHSADAEIKIAFVDRVMVYVMLYAAHLFTHY